jgi:hypothetical protein
MTIIVSIKSLFFSLERVKMHRTRMMKSYENEKLNYFRSGTSRDTVPTYHDKETQTDPTQEQLLLKKIFSDREIVKMLVIRQPELVKRFILSYDS